MMATTKGICCSFKRQKEHRSDEREELAWRKNGKTRERRKVKAQLKEQDMGDIFTRKEVKICLKLIKLKYMKEFGTETA